MTIYSKIPDAEQLLALEPEELASILLEYLSENYKNDMSPLSRDNFANLRTVNEFPPAKQREVMRALMEAWVWLEREGFLAPEPEKSLGAWYFITRKGRRLATKAAFVEYGRGAALPRHLLHPLIAQKVWPAFIRGEYDTAIFQAFREVEVMVREKGGYSNTDYGVPLMRRAFHPTTGPLRDPAETEGERQALCDLFAGGMGYFKNPQSHRIVGITDAGPTVEMIMLASHLIRIVDARVPIRGEVS